MSLITDPPKRRRGRPPGKREKVLSEAEREARAALFDPDSPDCPIVQVMEREYYLKETQKPIILQPHQKRILNAAFTPVDGKFPYRTIIYSAIKKSGKTEIGGGIGYAFSRLYGGNVYSIANDEDQAASRMWQRVVEVLELMRQKNPELYAQVVYPDHWEKIFKGRAVKFAEVGQTNPGPHTLEYIPNDYKGEAGGMPALTIWDELWAYSCLEIGTKVLRSDLTWVPIESVAVGEKIVGFDEHRGINKYRSFRESTVLHSHIELKEALEVKLENGQTLICTPEHPWLVRRGKHNSIDWFETRHLREGDRLQRAMPVWDQPTDYRTGYLAAAFDGEGCIQQAPRIGWRLNFSQKDNPMLETVCSYLRALGIHYNGNTKKRVNEVREIAISRKHDAAMALGMLRPKRLLPKMKIENLGRLCALEYVGVLSVTPVGKREICVLGTDTKTYLAEGYCAHNSSAAERLWTEMQPIPTLPVSMRLVTTYAGFYGESHLLYSIYEALVDPDPHTGEPRGERVPGLEDLPVFRKGSYFCYWDEEPRMPWHTPEFMAEARNDPSLNGREQEYERIWRNRWVTGLDAFLPMSIINARMAEGDTLGLVNHMAGM